MPWEPDWPKDDERGLARYVTADAVTQVALKGNRTDLLAGPDKRAGRLAVVEAIYQALVDADIRYANEPFNSSNETQSIRTPSEILTAPREGTCLDLAVLFCGLCIGNDLAPILVLIKGHAFAMVALSVDRVDAANRRLRPELSAIFRRGHATDSDALRQLIEQQTYVAVECTGFAHSTRMSTAMPEGDGRINGRLSFERASGAGYEQFEIPGRELVFALDLCSLQTLYGFKPLVVNKTGASGGVSISNTASNYGAQGVFNSPVTINNTPTVDKSQHTTNTANVQGNQTNITGDVSGPILSGTFSGPVVLGGNTGTVNQINVSGGATVGNISQHTTGTPIAPSEQADKIKQQQELLAVHRSTLAHYLKQSAVMGSAYAPPAVMHGIREARQGIVKVKAALRGWGVSIVDHPDDM